MAKRQREKTVATLRHEDASRKNIPTAEFRSVMERAEQGPVQVAYQRRNRDLDPQLVWRGKDAQDWSDLVVQGMSRKLLKDVKRVATPRPCSVIGQGWIQQGRATHGEA